MILFSHSFPATRPRNQQNDLLCSKFCSIVVNPCAKGGIKGFQGRETNPITHQRCQKTSPKQYLYHIAMKEQMTAILKDFLKHITEISRKNAQLDLYV